MKTLKTLIIALCAFLVCSNTASAALNLQNGISAGKALLSLYSQYKADGKLDLSNTTNINNIISLVDNIQGLTTKSTTDNTNTSFLSGLLSGSKNLVTTENSNTVLSALGSIANTDTSSLTSSVAKAAATTAASSLLKKATGSTTTSTSSNAGSTISNVLSSLFSSLGK